MKYLIRNALALALVFGVAGVGGAQAPGDAQPTGPARPSRRAQAAPTPSAIAEGAAEAPVAAPEAPAAATAPEAAAPAPTPDAPPPPPGAPPTPAPTLVPARKPVAPGMGRVMMNFKDAEVEAVVKYISELTGKNFLLDDKVKGRVTVISPADVTADEAYEIFQAILAIQGYTIVPSGKVFKIMPQAEAKQSTIETLYAAGQPGERFVTRIVPLKYIDAPTAVKILDPLRSKNSSLVAYEPANTLIFIDSNANIERLLGIIAAIDVETPGVGLEIFKIRYAVAETIAKTLTDAVVESRKGAVARRAGAPQAPAPGGAAVQVDSSGGSIKIIPDARTNSIIVIATPEAMADIRAMLGSLDVEIPSGTGKINVHHLKYADAETVASVLNAISQSAGTKEKPGQPQGAPGAPQVSARGAAGKVDVPVKFEEPVNITADKSTNSLVIVAMPQDYQTLREVIDQLDVRRPQVLVEALIVEMSYQRAMELGVEWRTTTDPTKSGKSLVGGQNFGGMSGLASLATNPFAGPSGLFLAAIDGTVELGGVTFPNVGALVSALQTKGDIEVLSTPHLLTTDNVEAEIIVSNNIPFQTSEKFDSNGNPIYTFEYRDVGLKLTFTPQINDDDFVKLKLFQEISDVVSTATGGSKNAPSTTKRSAKTTVVAKDGATIVIGGLIQKNKDLAQSSVPCLGDLPIIGMLFRSQSTRNDKTNLMIFLTPRIIRTTEDMERATQKKRTDYDEEMKRQRDIDKPHMKDKEEAEPGEAK